MKKPNIELQELAEFMRNAAYSDNQKHKMDWSLRVIHPRTNDGDVGFAGGLWSLSGSEVEKSIHLSYSETKGIYNFKLWEDGKEIRYPYGDKPDFDEFKSTVIAIFGIEKLYEG